TGMAHHSDGKNRISARRAISALPCDLDGPVSVTKGAVYAADDLIEPVERDRSQQTLVVGSNGFEGNNGGLSAYVASEWDGQHSGGRESSQGLHRSRISASSAGWLFGCFTRNASSSPSV